MTSAHDRSRLRLATGLMCIENALRVAQPLILGLAINDLLASSYRGLMLFAGQHLMFALAGAARRAEDARCDVNTPGRSDPSQLGARFSLFGALLMLTLFDAMLAPLCLLLLLPAALLHAAYGRQTNLLLSRQSHLNVPAPAETERVKLSDATAIQFALMQLFVLGMIATTLVHYCINGSSLTGGEIQAGDAFAVFLYVMMFIEAVEVPLFWKRPAADHCYRPADPPSIGRA